MLCAIVADFVRIPDVHVTTTWDTRLGNPPRVSSLASQVSRERLHTIVVDSPTDELPIFRELADLCDGALVIAPETHGLLEQRCRIVEGTRGRLLGPTSDGVRLCTSKLETARRLNQRGVPAVPAAALPLVCGADSTALSSAGADLPPLSFPLVIKPDDGAGSQSTWLIRDEWEFERLRPTLEADPLLANPIWQPFVEGRAVSVGVLISADGAQMETLPPAEQTLSDDGRFHYLGGLLPAREVERDAIQRAARAACQAIEGLRGYVGVDLVVPDSDPVRPIVVEINPRLTTSYLGYRRLADCNLAERMLNPGRASPIVWHSGPIRFSVDDQVAEFPSCESNRRCDR